MSVKITNLDHALSRLRKSPEGIASNISMIKHLAMLECILYDRYNKMSESQILSEYKAGLYQLEEEINAL